MKGLLLDLRVATRNLIRSPGFTTLAIVTIGLGIGLNTALFSLVDSVLFRALPFHEPDRLVEIWGQDAEGTGRRVPGVLVEALRQRSKTMKEIAIHGPMGGTVSTPDGPVDIRGERVSANFFNALGIAPAAGRWLLPEDGRSALPVMVISHRFWQSHLGGVPRVVGRTITLDTVAYTIVGVMPSAFRTSFQRTFNTQFWTTHVSDQLRQFEAEEGYELIGRLAPAVGITQALRELDRISATVQVDAWSERGRRLGMVKLLDEIVRDSARALKLMWAAVAVVLAIVCSNLALLLLARSDRRIAEFATRKAIGAPAASLMRLSLLESGLFAFAGGLAGIGLAHAVVPLMVGLAPTEIPRISESTVDWRVTTVALMLTLVTACALGFLPAIRLTRLPVLLVMNRASNRISSFGWFRSTLVSVQVAASVILCVLAGLVGRTYLTLLPSDAGFETELLAVIPLYISPRQYPGAEQTRLVNELVARLEATPGIRAAGSASNIPFSGDDSPVPVRNADEDVATAASADLRRISANYFMLLQLPVLRGRSFTNADSENAPHVAIVNALLARRLAPAGEVLGRQIRIGRNVDSPAYQIVGVVRDTRSSGSTLDIQNEVYVPSAQRPSSFNFLIVQTQLSPATLTSAIQRAVRVAAPDLPMSESLTARPLAQLIVESLAGPRFSATLSGAFSATAVLLAMTGVFGLVAYSVAGRKQEFGIRSALGATPGNLAEAAVRPVVVLTTAGVGLGLMMAAYLTRFVGTQLYGVEPLDVPTFIGAAAVMLFAAGVAAFIPARRAATVQPMSALNSA
jgi:putative ABC transport system permease protein